MFGFVDAPRYNYVWIVKALWIHYLYVVQEWGSQANELVNRQQAASCGQQSVWQNWIINPNTQSFFQYLHNRCRFSNKTLNHGSCNKYLAQVKIKRDYFNYQSKNQQSLGRECFALKVNRMWVMFWMCE